MAKERALIFDERIVQDIKSYPEIRDKIEKFFEELKAMRLKLACLTKEIDPEYNIKYGVAPNKQGNLPTRIFDYFLMQRRHPKNCIDKNMHFPYQGLLHQEPGGRIKRTDGQSLWGIKKFKRNTTGEICGVKEEGYVESLDFDKQEIINVLPHWAHINYINDGDHSFEDLRREVDKLNSQSFPFEGCESDIFVVTTVDRDFSAFFEDIKKPVIFVELNSGYNMWIENRMTQEGMISILKTIYADNKPGWSLQDIMLNGSNIKSNGVNRIPNINPENDIDGILVEIGNKKFATSKPRENIYCISANPVIIDEESGWEFTE